MDSKQISIVIPAYNEEQVIAALLQQIIDLKLADLHEIIVVDDGSKDATVEQAASVPGVQVVKHPYNIGNGAAVKSGIRAAAGNIIILMDGDGQHPPAEIPALLRYIDEYEMVVGARTAQSQTQWHRDIANGIFNRYASYIVGYPVPDLTSGFRVIRANIARNFLYLLPNGYSYPTTLTISLFRAGYAVKYQPFISPARVGKSKIRPLRDGLRFLFTITRLAILFVPMKIFLPISTLFVLSGGFYTLTLLILDRRFSGFGGLITTIGVFMFLLGLVSEQIAMLRYINSDR